MITKSTVKTMPVDGLYYLRAELGEVIGLQETMVQMGYQPQKLGQYHDELYLVAAELKRRGH